MLKSLILTGCAMASFWMTGVERLEAAPRDAHGTTSSTAPSATGRAVAAATTRSTDEQSLGSAKDYEVVKTIVVSFDANHLAFLGVKGKVQQVVMDGIPGPLFEWVMPDSLQMVASGRHTAYIVQTTTQSMVVVDGKTEPGFFTIGHDRIFFSLDGSRHAYGAKPSDQPAATMVVDGKIGATYDAVDWPLFSADAKHLSFRAEAGGKQFMVLDGKPLKAHDRVPDASQIFSPDSKHLGYEAIDAGKHFVVFDEKERGPFDGLRLGPGFNTTGTALVAVVDVKDKMHVLVNDQLGPGYDALISGDLAFSPDGKHVAYAARRGDKVFIVRDGTETPAAGTVGISTLHFSPDSSNLVYESTVDDKCSIISDKAHFDAYDRILLGTPIFSPDSKRIGAVANRGDSWCIVIDGVAGEMFDAINKRPPMDVPSFSPDSKRVAYRAIRNKEAMAIVDGKVLGRFDAIGPVVFSPDSKHVVFLGRRGETTHVMVDDRDTGLHYDGRLPTEQVVFDSNNSCHFIAVRDSEFLRVTVKVDQAN